MGLLISSKQGEKSLKLFMLESFDKKALRLTVDILTTDDKNTGGPPTTVFSQVVGKALGWLF